jgi:DNA processing protein
MAEFARRAPEADPERMAAELERLHIHTVMPEEDIYPALLRECPGTPPLLFYKGELRAGQEGIGIVGARRATAYGKAAADKLAREVAAGGYVVVSGLARGIDGAAHQGALAAGGATWAFMAGGLDRVYPGEHRRLAAQITDRGGALLSEYAPGTPWEPERFPARNRLISGVSRGVVVVEAGLRSGSLITADMALEQGRDVFAVPGPIFSAVSCGTHQLLRLGAILAAGGEDILSEYAGERAPRKSLPPLVQGELWPPPGEEKPAPELTGPQTEILNCLSDLPLHIDALALQCDQSAPTVAISLLELELAGRILKMPGQHYVLARL